MPDEKKHITSESDAFEAWMAQALGEYNEPGTGFGRSMMRNAFGAGAAWHAYEASHAPPGEERLREALHQCFFAAQMRDGPGIYDPGGVASLRGKLARVREVARAALGNDEEGQSMTTPANENRETLGQRVAQKWFWPVSRRVGNWPSQITELAALVDRLSPPPSRAGEEGVEARAKALAEEIDRRYMDWHHEMPRAENLAPPLTRALESERERCAVFVDEWADKHAASALAKIDDGLAASVVSHQYIEALCRMLAAAIRDGAKGA